MKERERERERRKKRERKRTTVLTKEKRAKGQYCSGFFNDPAKPSGLLTLPLEGGGSRDLQNQASVKGRLKNNKRIYIPVKAKEEEQ